MSFQLNRIISGYRALPYTGDEAEPPSLLSGEPGRFKLKDRFATVLHGDL